MLISRRGLFFFVCFLGIVQTNNRYDRSISFLPIGSFHLSITGRCFFLWSTGYSCRSRGKRCWCSWQEGRLKWIRRVIGHVRRRWDSCSTIRVRLIRYTDGKEIDQHLNRLTTISDQLLNRIPEVKFSKGINGSYCLKKRVIIRT